MFKIVCITQRSLFKNEESFLKQIKAIAVAGTDAIILREKDLSQKAYAELAQKVIDICEKSKTTCILHEFIEVALELGDSKIHLPLPILEKHPEVRKQFKIIGVSVHSPKQAQKALDLGATYLMAGHVFETDCKKGLNPRGLGFLREICDMTEAVYGIGGINEKNIIQIKEAGAAGACIMSGFMNASDPVAYIKSFRQNLKVFV